MNTYFAPAERAENGELRFEIEIASQSPVINGLLQSVGGLLVVLNEHRQIIALNDSFLKMLGIEDGQQELGLRPGEAIGCIHASETEGGCGTTKFCRTCGAAIAIVTSLGMDKPMEKICALTAKRNGSTIDISLAVRSHPMHIDGKRFLLLFLQDITRQQQWAALERVFYHDINNMLTGLLGASQLLVDEHKNSALADIIHRQALRLSKEVEIQNCLSQTDAHNYQPTIYKLSAAKTFEEIQSLFANHPAAINKKLFISSPPTDLFVKTDISLLIRILGNMIINALEATENNGEVRLWIELDKDTLVFCVWNQNPITQDVALKIFQRHFSTKSEIGRGFGTYSMKLLGEKFLGGKVTFSTSEDKGTEFRFSLPT